jgi:HEAT repeat protein
VSKSYEEVKKEVVSMVIGDTSSVRLQGNAPLRFRQAYYDQITDPEKKEIVKKVLLEILTGKHFLSRQRLRSSAAYIAGDIGLMEAKPYIEKLAQEKKIQNSYLLIFVERALEKLNIPHQLSHEQLKRIVFGHMFGKYQSVHSRGEALYDFKRFFYDETNDLQKKEMIKKVLLEILSKKYLLPQKRLRSSAAYIAADIGMMEAKPYIEKIAAEKRIKSSHYYRIFEMALEKLK